MKVEVVHVAPGKCFTAFVEVADGATIQDAIDACGILRQFPEIDLGVLKVGVFSKVKPLNSALADGDRVEIYRQVSAVVAGAGKRAREAKADAGTAEAPKAVPAAADAARAPAAAKPAEAPAAAEAAKTAAAPTLPAAAAESPAAA